MPRKRRGRESFGRHSFAPNDDDAELRVRRSSARRKSLRLSTGVCATEVERMQKVMSAYSEVIKVCAQNKVSTKNAWTLDLIEHIDDILESQKGSFQKNSLTLQGAVQIYEKRVDAAHRDTYAMLENVNRTSQFQEEEAVAVQEDGKAASKKKNTSGKNTLESNIANIDLKTVDREFDIDPLFKKMSAAFDEGGAKGMLLHNLGTHNGCEVVFDTGDVAAFGGAARLADENGVTGFARVDLSSVDGELTLANSLETLYAALDGYQNRGGGSAGRFAKTIKKPVVSGEKAQELRAAEAAAPEEMRFGDDDYAFWDEFKLQQQQRAEEDDDDDEARRALRWDDRLVEAGGDGAAEQTTYKEIAFVAFPVAATADSWAGPSHWKLAKPKKVEVLPVDEPKPTTTRKKKEPFFIDFSAELPADFFVKASVPPSRPSSLLLKVDEGITNALPDDMHYDVATTLYRLFTKRTAAISRRVVVSHAHMDPGIPAAPCAATMEANVKMFQNDDLRANLVDAGRVVKKVEVGYAKRAKRVDVKKLKANVWGEIEEFAPRQPYEFKDDVVGVVEPSHGVVASAPPPGMSFSVLAAKLAKDAPADVTVPFYFITALHLANEHNLELRSNFDLTDFSITIAA